MPKAPEPQTLAAHGNSSLTPKAVHAIFEAVANTDKTMTAIAKEFGVSQAIVQNIAHKRLHKKLLACHEDIDFSVTSERFARMAKTHPNRPVLTPNIVSQIRVLLQMGLSQKEIAAQYQVSRATICNIAKRKTWRDA